MLETMYGDVSAWVWAAFIAGVAALLVVDLVLVHRHPHVIGAREAAIQSAAWVALALGFGVLLLVWRGSEMAGEYYAGYLIEKSLSIDNVFVWALIFVHFAVPGEFQHRVLFWGIFGAIVMRAVFIFGGVALLDSFEWLIYVLGVFLLVSAVRLLLRDESRINPNRHPFGRFVRGWAPAIAQLDGPRFFIRHGAVIVATPLLAVLLLVETTDLVFAVDSVPAVLGVSRNEFVVFTSNVLAILGLRALYFLFTALGARFAYLQQGMAVVLGFVGVKMLLSSVVDVPVGLSLAVIAMILTVSVLSSIWVRRGEETWPAPAEPARG
ncbi:MAG TPA: TerC/Alx family metal homeostasis membrane protein [Acidimicrobiia bacterium]